MERNNLENAFVGEKLANKMEETSRKPSRQEDAERERDVERERKIEDKELEKDLEDAKSLNFDKLDTLKNETNEDNLCECRIEEDDCECGCHEGKVCHDDKCDCACHDENDDLTNTHDMENVEDKHLEDLDNEELENHE